MIRAPQSTAFRAQHHRRLLDLVKSRNYSAEIFRPQQKARLRAARVAGGATLKVAHNSGNVLLIIAAKRGPSARSTLASASARNG